MHKYRQHHETAPRKLHAVNVVFVHILSAQPSFDVNKIASN